MKGFLFNAEVDENPNQVCLRMENSMSLGAELQRLEIATENGKLDQVYEDASEDLRSVTRAQAVNIGNKITDGAITILNTSKIKVAIVE